MDRSIFVLDPNMPNDMIRYDLLVQEALCGVVSKVLADVARNGLPGDHHFYITFRTHAPGVRLSSRMRELYPEEMTIILQHQFEDLKVTEHAFEVGLSFKGVPEILLIPFEAMTGFFDPSVQFSLKFEPLGDGEEESSSGPGVVSSPMARLEPKSPAPLALATVPKTQDSRAQESRTQDSRTTEARAAELKIAAPKAVSGTPPNDDAVDSRGEGPAEEAKVVSIDAFRKKP